jgi:hypothetical protein
MNFPFKAYKIKSVSSYRWPWDDGFQIERVHENTELRVDGNIIAEEKKQRVNLYCIRICIAPVV